MLHKALFLDRDGVINIEKNYLYKISEFEFIDGIFDVCRYFQRLDYFIVVITNQAGIARGLYTEDDFIKLNNWMIGEFKSNNINITKVYYCPHHPEFGVECECRKPRPGMILRAKAEIGIDLQNSILVGDKISDVEAGINAGIGRNYLITTDSSIKESIYFNKISNIKELVKYAKRF
ncbi:D-glycero-alpha-D-manno-heptose-1,7-bisphosphate 7-phosphatase [Campylobacter concisus]|uniref:D-glycero-alpha-D-manno-heptose-1,7-bisphosphate 7-phosphatase n=1 Tax=Campylobacter concisus TaxID=199 RepID=UPI000CD82581|nr:HAD family hydrolase [Campylobacter concisus]MBE9818744.1 HAD family hydrolase [Campylobacter concisus]